MKQGVVAGLIFCGALIAAPVLTGCCKKSSGGDSSAVLGTTGELVTINDAGLKFNAPGGWMRYPAGRWIRYKPADNLARLAFATFDRPGESTALIGQIASQLDIGAINWGSGTESRLIGPNRLPAQVGKGDCKVGGTGEPCYVEYATINPGRSTQLLMVYVVNLSKGSQHKANAAAALASLSKL